MSKYDKIVLGVIMFVVGGVFFFYTNIFDNRIMDLENKIRYLISQCEYQTTVYLCNHLIRLYQYQLDVVENLYIAFTTIGWILIISGAIYMITMMERELKRNESK